MERHLVKRVRKNATKGFDVRFEWHSHYPFFYDAACFVYRRGELKNTVKVSFGDQDSTKENIQNYMLMFYIAYLISSLKKDFTGYSIDPIEILLIKINDIDSHKNKPLFEQAEKNVRKELKKLGVTI